MGICLSYDQKASPLYFNPLFVQWGPNISSPGKRWVPQGRKKENGTNSAQELQDGHNPGWGHTAGWVCRPWHHPVVTQTPTGLSWPTTPSQSELCCVSSRFQAMQAGCWCGSCLYILGAHTIASLILLHCNRGKKLTTSSSSPQKTNVSYYSAGPCNLFDVLSPAQSCSFPRLFLHINRMLHVLYVAHLDLFKDICPNSLHFPCHLINTHISQAQRHFYSTSPCYVVCLPKS